ncbi:MAG: prepilin-type N-terminal cleavage/methylation domain-containing protein [Candidatus Pacebacteria bacterium]|nr:prepilin-type N-terminal cleavage/methylation domain-containing protein [Candidatus Paceibacterota bacterium]
MKNKSFTLIELLVVIVIIGVLAGVIMVTVSSSVSNATFARAKAFSSNVQNSMLLNLVSEWTFDEGSNQTINRAATNDDVKDNWGINNGTIVATHEPTVMGNNNCVYGKCLNFNNTESDYINCGNDSSLIFSDGLSISMWVKPRLSVDVDNGHLIRRDGNFSSGNNGFYLFRQSSDVFQLQLLDHGATNTTTLSSTSYTIPAGEWIHLVALTDRTTVKLYINGSLNNQCDDLTSDNLGATTTSMYIGSNNGAANVNYFNGAMDDIRLYNKALSQAQIKQNYIAGLNSMLANGNISEEEFSQRINNLAITK